MERSSLYTTVCKAFVVNFSPTPATSSRKAMHWRAALRALLLQGSDWRVSRNPVRCETSEGNETSAAPATRGTYSLPGHVPSVSRLCVLLPEGSCPQVCFPRLRPWASLFPSRVLRVPGATSSSTPPRRHVVRWVRHSTSPATEHGTSTDVPRPPLGTDRLLVALSAPSVGSVCSSDEAKLLR